jgi:hypothetical protein
MACARCGNVTNDPNHDPRLCDPRPGRATILELEERLREVREETDKQRQSMQERNNDLVKARREVDARVAALEHEREVNLLGNQAWCARLLAETQRDRKANDEIITKLEARVAELEGRTAKAVCKGDVKWHLDIVDERDRLKHNLAAVEQENKALRTRLDLVTEIAVKRGADLAEALR